MRFKVTSLTDLWSGLLFVAIGGTAGVVALQYPVGTLSRMGPGYFPLVLSGFLALVGGAMLVRSTVVVEAPPSGFRPRAIFLVLGGAAVFAAGVEQLGLALTSFLLIVVTYLGGWEVSWRRMLALGVGMAAFVVVLFVLLLNMQFKIGPAPWS
jgi:hypothetical protein